MYTPKHFQVTEQQQTISFMQKYSFAAIVTMMNGVPEATHLPFVVEQRGDEVVLLSHFAKANPQVNVVENETSLVVFTEPHAYVSPKHYEKELNVPTWNYIAVHAYGKATLIKDETAVAGLLAKTIGTFEEEYLSQWNKLPEDYKRKMMNGIVAFELAVTDLQAKYKLSQNRSETEQQNMINSFSNSTSANETDIARYMRDLKH
ncbi:FMN-binding negative transcriptional regulator [Mucilaginibacter conchicola]|uniref:FMN-binding negative transcriptional regulator n=1 Tax=Mucilaginibacter conchicola TaxID=2303333 RepID=A0A372NWD2_9SPHI|nr:FMN-binding negative transcriptional regulator [Mucilaginibacter conchicola]RFZ94420.1 FMN-binding negative transcriptional regulator [Mucilaginibacter conchicola]